MASCPHCGNPKQDAAVTCGDSYCSELHHVERVLAGHCAKHQKTKAYKAWATTRRAELVAVIDERVERERETTAAKCHRTACTN